MTDPHDGAPDERPGAATPSRPRRRPGCGARGAGRLLVFGALAAGLGARLAMDEGDARSAVTLGALAVVSLAAAAVSVGRLSGALAPRPPGRRVRRSLRAVLALSLGMVLASVALLLQLAFGEEGERPPAVTAAVAAGVALVVAGVVGWVAAAAGADQERS